MTSALKDPATGKPLAIIVDDKGPNLIDLAHSSIVSGDGKKHAVPKKTLKKSTAPDAKPAVKAKSSSKAKVEFDAETKKLLKAKKLTPA